MIVCISTTSGFVQDEPSMTKMTTNSLLTSMTILVLVGQEEGHDVGVVDRRIATHSHGSLVMKGGNNAEEWNYQQHDDDDVNLHSLLLSLKEPSDAKHDDQYTQEDDRHHFWLQTPETKNQQQKYHQDNLDCCKGGEFVGVLFYDHSLLARGGESTARQHHSSLRMTTSASDKQPKKELLLDSFEHFYRLLQEARDKEKAKNENDKDDNEYSIDHH